MNSRSYAVNIESVTLDVLLPFLGFSQLLMILNGFSRGLGSYETRLVSLPTLIYTTSHDS